MRISTESRSRLLARVAVLAVIAAGAAGCSTDVSRFTDGPFSGPTAARSGPSEVTGSVPSGRVTTEPLGSPSRAANSPSGGVATGGGGMASYHPPAAAAATRVANASAPIAGGRATPPIATPPAATHVVVPGETLTSIARHYGKSRVDIARANRIDAYAIVRVGQKLTIPGVR